MTFTETLDHVCVHGARLNIHRVPQIISCPNCGQGDASEFKLHFTKENAAKFGVDFDNPNCPDCGDEMQHSGSRDFGELHLTICLDDRVHLSQMLRDGEITVSEFETRKAQLSDRELLGYFDHRTHNLCVRLDADEVELFASDPEALVAAIMPKIKSRLELDVQFQMQHKPTVTQHDVKHLFKNALK